MAFKFSVTERLQACSDFLGKFARHAPDCQGIQTDGFCSCGFDRALKELHLKLTAVEPK